MVRVKIKRPTPLSRLMRASCGPQGLSVRQVSVPFDGQPTHESDIHAQLDMDRHVPTADRRCLPTREPAVLL